MATDYESSRLMAEYLLFHYGAEDEVMPTGGSWPAGMREALGFPLRTVAHFSDTEVERSLDLGCAVGRSSFELARRSRQVIGIDFSERFIEVARQLAAGESVPYVRLEEGQVETPMLATAPAEVDRTRVAFEAGDAMALPQELGAFDRVHASNLLCRLPEPLCLLERLPSLVKRGGELVMATPATWLEEFTPRDRWPVGRTLDWLMEKLGNDFDLRCQCEEPFLIRETARKFQWSSSLVTVWERK